MAPHDLLCKWCSTFVGKHKKFCSIFCESRHTRSKRRKLAFKRPVYSSGPRDEPEYVSPRSNKTAPTRKESFLEDVITAIENDKPSPERDKHRPHGDTSSTTADRKSPPSSARLNQSTGSQQNDSLSTAVPKLDLSSPKVKSKKQSGEDNAEEKAGVVGTDKGADKHDRKSGNKFSAIDKNDRSKTRTLLVHNKEKKSQMQNKVNSYPDRKSILQNVSLNHYDEENETMQTHTKKTGSAKTRDISDVVKAVKAAHTSQRQRSKTDMEKNVRSSGYGNPINPRLRPMAIKPRSATVTSTASKPKRETSAKSTKSATVDMQSTKKDPAKPTVENFKANRDLIPTTITEETSRQLAVNGNSELDNESSTSENSTSKSSAKSSARKSTRSDGSTQELAKIHEILREESTHSDLLSQTELQLRLSSIKRKVEVRRRGRDSRSSYGSDLDTSFQDSTADLTVDKEGMKTSSNKDKLPQTARTSARSNVTRISKQFQPNTSETSGPLTSRN